MLTEEILLDSGCRLGAQEGSGDKDSVSGLRHNGAVFTNVDSVSTAGS